MKASDFFTDTQKKQIEEAISYAEKQTSCEVRVHIELYCKKSDVKDCASYTFARLGMHKTKLRNGVLIYLAIKDKKFAIIGDVGINIKVGQTFWDEVKNIMQEHFQQAKFTEGLVEAILMIGEKLKIYFPYQKDDVNELPDQISFN